MKKITILLLVFLSVTSSFAHELPLPHAHKEYIHGFDNFIIFVAIPILVIFISVKLISKIRRSGRA
ncbi:MAG: hypothetical protein RIC53_09340 [Cyclobacteriaceae bacterium]